MRPDSSLVQAVIAGESHAFAELIGRYQRVTLATAWKILGDSHAAEDVAQQAFLIAYQKLGDLRDQTLFGSWLVRIVQREAIRVYGERGNSTEPLDRDVTASQSPTTPADVNEELMAAMAKLPEHELVVVSLHYLDGHSVKSISELTGRPIGTVTKQLSRAVIRLKTYLLEPSQ
jgi:RNA polymerase sigma-70 factor (ECF subfamily)